MVGSRTPALPLYRSTPALTVCTAASSISVREPRRSRGLRHADLAGVAVHGDERAILDQLDRIAELDGRQAVLAGEAGAVRQHAAGLEHEALDQREARHPARVRAVA